MAQGSEYHISSFQKRIALKIFLSQFKFEGSFRLISSKFQRSNPYKCFHMPLQLICRGMYKYLSWIYSKERNNNKINSWLNLDYGWKCVSETSPQFEEKCIPVSVLCMKEESKCGAGLSFTEFTKKTWATVVVVSYCAIRTIWCDSIVFLSLYCSLCFLIHISLHQYCYE